MHDRRTLRSHAPPSSIRILVVDDSARIRRGLCGLIDLTDDMEIVGEAADGEQALSLITTSHPDVVLIDLLMPGIGGLETTKQIRRQDPGIGVVAVTAMPGGGELALGAGAHTVLTKDADPLALLAAVRSVAEAVALGPQRGLGAVRHPK